MGPTLRRSMIQAIFETVCIRITVILIIRFVFEEAFKLMFVLGKYFFYSFTTVETAAHFFFNVGCNLLMSTIVFQLYGCFQEFFVGVEKVARSMSDASTMSSIRTILRFDPIRDAFDAIRDAIDAVRSNLTQLVTRLTQFATQFTQLTHFGVASVAAEANKRPVILQFSSFGRELRRRQQVYSRFG